MMDLEHYPDWMKVPIMVMSIMSMILIFIVTIMVVHALTRGPYHKPLPPGPHHPLCGNSGVKQIVKGDDGDLSAIICNNGDANIP